MKKILLFGKNGQLGWELQRSLCSVGHVIALSRADYDFEKPGHLRTFIDDIAPDVIVNAAAYTLVDKAEEEKQIAAAINATAPGILAEEAKRLKIPLIHYSTDYVFDGSGTRPYLETDQPNPINEYGRSKLAGEQAIRSVGCDHLILRTSWIYGQRGHNFYLTMLRLGAEKKELRIVNDQIGTPNWSRIVAQTTTHLIEKATPGLKETVHVSCRGMTSWFDFARLIFESVPEEKRPSLIPISTSEYPTAAQRPQYSTLDCSKLANIFGLELPRWDMALSLVTNSYTEADSKFEYSNLFRHR